MILRDPVHGLVVFEGEVASMVEPLVDTVEVQRLRRVRQLGLTSFVFPGAEHSRFAHALGTAHVMVRLLARVEEIGVELPASERPDVERRRDAVAAALLHDLGHGPFSHLFEEVFPGGKHHEMWTREILEDDSTSVHRALCDVDPRMPARVVALLSHAEDPRDYLARAISGILDVDRCDYLLRDSHMTGVSYGLYDLEWLLRSLRFGEVAGRTVLGVDGGKGLPALEGFFLGRQFMFQQVYHHKATRGAECLVRAMFRRVCELVVDGSTPAHTPRALVDAALGRRVSLRDYLAMDDGVMGSAFGEWESCDDPVLRDVATRFRRRRLFKTMTLPEDGPAGWAQKLDVAREIVARRGLRPDLYAWLDVAEDVPYAEPEDEASPDVLQVLGRQGPARRLGDASFILRELRNKRHVRPRLVFAHEVRDEVTSALGVPM